MAFGDPLLWLHFVSVYSEEEQKSHLRKDILRVGVCFLGECVQVWKATTYPLLWHHWHPRAADPLHPTAHRHVTAPIDQKAHWADRPILWTPFLSRFLTRQIIPVFSEKRAPGDPAVWTPLAGTADLHMDTLVRELTNRLWHNEITTVVGRWYHVSKYWLHVLVESGASSWLLNVSGDSLYNKNPVKGF